MRSTLIFVASAKIENRFLLASIVMQATKKLHVPATRTEDTINNVFTEVAKGPKIEKPTHRIAPLPVADNPITYSE